MKKKICLSLVLLALCLSFSQENKAQLIDNPTRSETFYEKPTLIRCTCYLDSGTTASGQTTRKGIIAGRKEWLGKVAALYRVENGEIGQFLGYYEFLDTGAGMDSNGDGYGDTIKNGYSVDVWQPTMADAKTWIKDNGDYVWLQIIDGEG